MTEWISTQAAQYLLLIVTKLYQMKSSYVKLNLNFSKETNRNI